MSVAEVLQKTAVPVSDLEALKLEKDELAKHRLSLLPVEAALRDHIDKRLEEIQTEAFTFLGSLDGHSENPLPVIDQSVLDWRHDGKVKNIPIPKLALVNIKSTGCRIPFPKDAPVPEEIRMHYNDVAAACMRLHRASSSRRSGISGAHIMFEYKGAIPSDIRKMILDEKGQFEEMFLMVDTPLQAWEYGHTALARLPIPTIVLDPLVCGYRRGSLYLLGQFDPTPIETYIELEFTNRPALNKGE